MKKKQRKFICNSQQKIIVITGHWKIYCGEYSYAIDILYAKDKTRDHSHMGALEKKQWIKI